MNTKNSNIKKPCTIDSVSCRFCKHWERDWVWSPKDGKVAKRYGECHNEKFYKDFSWAYQHDMERQFPTAKPDENFGCKYFESNGN